VGTEYSWVHNHAEQEDQYREGEQQLEGHVEGDDGDRDLFHTKCHKQSTRRQETINETHMQLQEE
jgi:hypothetical protein